ncbi:MAG TPA: asparagine synthase (glutamine-hydrolyzing) [Gemmatimonadales bacterium]|nr:asparagine synthase (glutamine-hydrolyzing) [Gemmatimonadales bacterium]
MCGFVTLVCTSGQRVPGRVLRGMTTRLAHRGPDDTGFAAIDPHTRALRCWGRDLPSDVDLSGILFGHCRLSILDLTAAAHQPMVSDDGSSVLAFNGEIYNFLELRSALSAAGVTFRGTGDTEVLLKAYECWGADALNRLNGMWAFLLWDGRRRALIASRDRFGVKPLYYAIVDEVLIFSSEIKAILAYPGAFKGFHEPRVLDFLRDGLTDQDEETMFTGVRSLAPGSYMEITPERRVTTRFWTLPDGPAKADGAKADGADANLIEAFASHLADSVRLRVRSDVPIGTMMSGGLDSTAITSLIRAQQQGRGGDERFDGLAAFHHTFSACWPGSEADEEATIDLVCSELSLISHKLYPTPEQIADVLPKVAHHLDEPFHDPIAAVQYLLMQKARSYGVKVVLNGHGSDESLGGYHKLFVPPLLADLLLAGNLVTFVREQRAFKGSGWAWSQVVWHLLMRLLPEGARLDPRTPSRLLERLRGAGGVLADGPAATDSGETRSNGELSNPFSFPGSLRFEFTTRNLPRWLRMEDRMSMAWSVESRLPFMDYRLVEFAFRLPDRLKLRDGYNKYILRQATRTLLPRRLIETRSKLPFLAPYSTWLRGPWRSMVGDLLLGSSQVGAYLNRGVFVPKLQSFMKGKEKALPHYLVWRLLITELWLREFAGSGSRQSRDSG